MFRQFITGLGLVFLLAPAAPAQQPASPSFTLDQLLAAAFEQSAELRVRRAEVEQARGHLVAARTYPFNPEVSVDAAGRRSSGARSTDQGLEVAQEIEIGGQRRRRTAVAEAVLQGAEARFRHEGQLLASRVALAFADAVRARELLRVEESDATLAGDLLRFEEKRLEAGEATQIDVNLARATAGRSLRRLELARGAYIDARSALAAAASLDPAAPPEPAGVLEPASTSELPPLPVLVRSALAGRQDLAAFRNAEEEARAEVQLQQSFAIPNLVARAFRQREGGTDNIAGAGLAVAVPLFNRNRGEIAEARAAVDRVAAEAAAARLAVEREVASAFATYAAARAAAEGLRSQVIGNLRENLTLLQRSFEEGKIGRSELYLFRREFIDSQREYLDVSAQARQARVRLELATGSLSIPVSTNRSDQP